MDTVLEYECPCCGGSLIFDSDTQKMKCEYCDSMFTVEELKNKDKVLDEEKSTESENMNWDKPISEELDGMTEYICQSCGAVIAGDANTAATECLYCGNPVMLTGNMKGMLKPEYVIPFKLNKEHAKKALNDFYSDKKLLPNLFKEKNRIDSIQGAYVPFWLYDCNATADIVYDAKKIKTWESGDYRYTKTDYYKVVRGGNVGFKRVPVDASSKMDDSYMDSIEPFDYSQIVEFQTAYLSGYLADKYDEDSKQCSKRAKDRITASTKSEFEKTVHGYDIVVPRMTNINMKNGKVSYAMFPVWMLSTKYNNEVYTFAMNGQTGKMIGRLPVDKGKAWLYFLAITGILSVIGTIINLFIF